MQDVGEHLPGVPGAGEGRRKSWREGRERESMGWQSSS